MSETTEKVSVDPEQQQVKLPPTPERISVEVGDTDEDVSTSIPPLAPEGGVQGWMAVLGCWCALFYTFGYVTSFGVYEEFYLQNTLRHKSASDIAWIGSIQTFSQFSATIISGPICDRYGPRVVIWPFSVTLVASLMLTSICKEYYQFLLCQGVLFGMSSGLIYAPAIAVVGHYFHRKRPMAMSVASTGSTMGGIIIPVVLTRLLNRSSLGFGWTQRIVGFLGMCLAIAACMTIRPGVKPRKGTWLLPKAFLDPAYSLQVVGLFLIIWGMWTPFFYLSTYGLEHGMSSQLATYLVALLNAGSLVGRMIGGILSLRAGQFNVVVAACFASAILIFSWLHITSTAGIIALTILYGATSGAIIALMIATLGQVAPHPNQIGTYIGMASGSFGLAGLTGTPITGAMISRYGGYSQAIIFSGSVVMAGSFLMLWARFSYAKGRLIV